MGRKDVTRFIKIEDEIAWLKRYQADLAGRIETLQRQREHDLIAVRDILTQQIEE